MAALYGYVYRSASGSVFICAPSRKTADRHYRLRFGGDDPAGDFLFSALLHLPNGLRASREADLEIEGSVFASHGARNARPIPLVGPIALEFVPHRNRPQVLPRFCSPRWSGRDFGFVLYR